MSDFLLQKTRLWLCGDLAVLRPDELVQKTRAALSLRGSLRVGLWLRGTEHLATQPLLRCATELRELTQAARAPLMIAQRVDVAVLCSADVIHCNRYSASPAQQRDYLAALGLMRSPKISRAIHTVAELGESLPHCSLLIAGPVGHVEGKGDALGPRRFADLRAQAGRTAVVAIGGFSRNSLSLVRDIVAGGANGIAVRRSFIEEEVQTSLPHLIEHLSQCYPD